MYATLRQQQRLTGFTSDFGENGQDDLLCGQRCILQKRHKIHKKEWFSARAQIFMDQIALNSIKFIPEDSNIGSCIVSVKKPALERPEYARVFLMGCLTSVDSRRILRSYRSQRLCSQDCVH